MPSNLPLHTIRPSLTTRPHEPRPYALFHASGPCHLASSAFSSAADAPCHTILGLAVFEMRQMTRPVANDVKRERSRSPRRGRSRSPGRSGRRRSYSPRSRSRGDSREDYRRQRSPMSAVGAPGGGSSTGYPGGPQHRSFEERQAAKEQRMSSIRETSQQDRRVYVGNLSYDVKWHHLKDFMRQGMFGCFSSHFPSFDIAHAFLLPPIDPIPPASRYSPGRRD